MTTQSELTLENLAKRPRAAFPLHAEVRQELLRRLQAETWEMVAWDLAVAVSTLKRAAQGKGMCRSTAMLITLGLGFRPAF